MLYIIPFLTILPFQYKLLEGQPDLQTYFLGKSEGATAAHWLWISSFHCQCTCQSFVLVLTEYDTVQGTAEEFGSVFSPQRAIHESAGASSGCSHSCHRQPM